MIRCLKFVLLLAPILAAQTNSSTTGLPPLIDRELLFGNPEIAGAQLSPDGKFIAFLKPWKNTLNVWVKKTAEPFSAARLLTAETRRPVSNYIWTRDGKFLCYVKDNNGDENFNLYAVDPSATAAQGADAPPSRDLTHLKDVAVQVYTSPKHDPDTIFIGVNHRDKAWHDLMQLKVASGDMKLVHENSEKISGWLFDLNGQLRLATRTADNGDQEVLRVEPTGFVPIYSCNSVETCSPARFHKDGKRVYMLTNKGDRDLTALALLDSQTGKTEIVDTDPLNRADLGAAQFSDLTDDLIFTSYMDDRLRRYFKSKPFEADFKFVQGKLPGKELGLSSISADEQIWLVSSHSDTEPGETYLFDRKAHTLTLQYRVREKLPREALATMESIRYKSSDGLEISAYLTLPKGVSPKGLPTLVIPHGGPWERDVWGYNPLAQFFANRGYAVLMPNFRASTGFGKKFLNAGNGEWGRKMQDDLTWGVQYLIAQGTTDPKRVGILGGSYGGYAALAGVAFTPDLYRAAVDIVGPSNLTTLLDSIPPYWESVRKTMYARMADPVTTEGKTWLRERSPLNEAGKIKAALMVVQGANDPRVNKAEAEQIVAALRDRNFPVEYLMAPDEGHGFARPINNLAMFTAAEKFLAKYLDGRYQETASPEVLKRLAEITVDPKSVKVATNVATYSMVLPKLAVDLKPGTYKYETKIALGGQEKSFQSSTTIKEENGAWTATDVAETPAGTATDTAILEKGTLVVRKRTIQQGSATVEIAYAEGKASGKMSAGGQSRTIAADLGGPLFADAAGSMQSLGCLPLAEGYSLSYRNFDLQRQRAKVMQLKVVGTESVTVPAGTFDAYKIQLSQADAPGSEAFIWIAKDTRQMVKMSTVAAANGPEMSSELLP